MRILPYDNFTIVTPDSLRIIVERLSTNIEPPKAFRFSTRHALYQGSIDSESFQISRIIHYRNSFLPRIRGRFEAQPHQTLIHIQMSINPFILMFLGIWFLFWYSAVVPITLTGAMPHQMAALFLGMPMLMLVIFWVAFWAEANYSRIQLTKIVQGQI